MRFRCLVLDHDDTVVDSTASIHFPAFLAYLRRHRPSLVHRYTATSYFEKNFDPGIVSLLRDEVGLSAEEMQQEEAFWAEYVRHHVPKAYTGMQSLLTRFRAMGGLIAVNSHSFSDYIRRDYEHNHLPMPDRIYGWDMEPSLRKPHPHALCELMRDFSLAPHEVLMVDDSKAGLDCARGAGVVFAAAGWAFDIPSIRNEMLRASDYYLSSVSALEKLLFANN